MPPEPPSIATNRYRRVLAQTSDYLVMLAVLAVLVLLFSVLSRVLGKNFLNATTFFNLANQNPALLVISVGMTYVLIIAGIDLSVGSVMGLCGAILGVALVDWGCPIYLAVPLCVLVGLACGAFNGCVTAAWAIPSFIVTLGMLEIARGSAYLVTDFETKYIGSTIEFVGAPLPGVGLSPAFFMAIAVVILGQLVLSRTVFGRHVFAVGGNPEAARLSGVSLARVRIAVFSLAGFLTGLGAWFHTGKLRSADPNAGIWFELSAIAAVGSGGTSLMGGRGSVIATFFGVLIIAVLESGLASIGAAEEVKRVVTGSVIILAVIADAYRHRLANQGWVLMDKLSLRKRGRS